MTVIVSSGTTGPFSSETPPSLSPGSLLSNMLTSILDDSLRVAVRSIILSALPPKALDYKLQDAKISAQSSVLYYAVDTASIKKIVKPIINRYSNPGRIQTSLLFNNKATFPSIEELYLIKLTKPFGGALVPKLSKLLPNAPRAYRNGIHRGIDFYIDWGTTINAMADGVVIRADHNYNEISPEFRQSLLNKTKKTGYTPSDIFEHILLGQTVYIDHGFSLLPGYRAVSIYAHLSYIEDTIRPGVIVEGGQLIGMSGNSGTEPSARGVRDNAHLHCELLLQNKSGEFYLGQGLSYDDLIPLLNKIFSY